VERGESGQDSDIDLLIEPLDELRVGGLLLARWKTLMSELLGRDYEAGEIGRLLTCCEAWRLGKASP
jgi:predicted nucleotidyltransferase